jgi:hypothetical protein
MVYWSRGRSSRLIRRVPGVFAIWTSGLNHLLWEMTLSLLGRDAIWRLPGLRWGSWLHSAGCWLKLSLVGLVCKRGSRWLDGLHRLRKWGLERLRVLNYLGHGGWCWRLLPRRTSRLRYDARGYNGCCGRGRGGRVYSAGMMKFRPNRLGQDILLIPYHLAPSKVVHECLKRTSFGTLMYPTRIQNNLAFLSDVLAI